MAITTTLATRYWLKTIIMAVVCLVLGVWGIWDYTVAIPKAIQEADRAEFLRETIQPALKVLEMGSEERDRATVKLNVTIEEDDGLDKNWSAALIEFKGALDGSGGSQQKADDLLGEYLNKYGSVTRPSKFDRPMQWLFILCLPLGFYYLWAYFKLAKRANAYRLDDDGTLTTPEGTWSAEEIKDIDMGRWIAKTGKARTTWTAKVIVENHSPILLDDYIYKDMHLIIGKLAHGFYPESWTPLARRARVDKIEESEVLGEEE